MGDERKKLRNESGIFIAIPDQGAVVTPTAASSSTTAPGNMGPPPVKAMPRESLFDLVSRAQSKVGTCRVSACGRFVVRRRFSFASGRLSSAAVGASLPPNRVAHCLVPPRLLVMSAAWALGFISKVVNRVLRWLWVSLWSLPPRRVKRRYRVTLVGRVSRRTFAALGRVPCKPHVTCW